MRSEDERLEDRVTGIALLIMFILALVTCIYGLTVTEMWPWQL